MKKVNESNLRARYLQRIRESFALSVEQTLLSLINVYASTIDQGNVDNLLPEVISDATGELHEILVDTLSEVIRDDVNPSEA